jgi:hypothetical protein
MDVKNEENATCIFCDGIFPKAKPEKNWSNVPVAKKKKKHFSDFCTKM